MALQQTILSQPRVDFVKSDFDVLIDQKGRRVLFEKALQCPCKSKSTNQQSDCKNCGGTGWVFVDPKETRMVLSSVSVVNEFKDWSEESRGFVNITSKDEDEVGWMDRITLLDGKAYMSEVLHFKKVDGMMFAFTAYPIKEMKYIATFDGSGQPLRPLRKDVDYTFQGQLIKLSEPFFLDQDVSASVRYVHAPQFYILELKRETMQTFTYDDGTEKLKHMPISALGRRAHYVLDPANAYGVGLIRNYYKDQSDCNGYGFVSQGCGCCQDYTNIMSGRIYELPFLNVSFVSVNHKLGYHPFMSIEDQNGETIEGRIVHRDNNIFEVSFSEDCSGIIRYH